MRSLRKQNVPALFVALVASAGLTSVALADGGGVGTGGGGGGGGGGHNYVFPLPAHHEYGDGFGAGRGHEGQDVFANCGSKLIANHSGRVQAVDRQSSAGNYIVLDADGTGIDYAYMHLKQKAIPREGSNVRKGEKIGEVGDTGNATGCHLHFEKWTAPGYYEGGHASRNVTKALKSWDKYS
ncbi:MAG: peptidoglycan LD-endopeptidase LytH [Solirubrobacterales bacterium]|jgi:murein DD-endopeptidase MepM/ murein hydrolase activator NlpD|nr:peptidoglycan LD-endopeptidase LytH [Solirubrobacterales bacterium]